MRVGSEKAKMMLGSLPKRIALHLILGLVLAIGRIIACLFSAPTYRNLAAFGRARRL
jgi:hypothetical protein